MDPNNNQPINTSPLGQPVAPQPNVAPPPVPEPVPTPMPGIPRNGSKKGIILIIILLILALGMAFYVFFVKNQLSNKQKTSAENTSIVIPTITATATPATVDQVSVASPDADLKAIESDVQGL